ncbi:hypothetical protein [Massilimicrobiota sp. An80]|uniref:RDAC family protein n=1 Tax=Massilimicrobiota sp. An80 TaxID=1965658 RepID=UPI000B452C26|nr:hypothetical protein [Massilimicrobiota sp. An80]OUN30048.1 hypothetical protein B5G32_13265 [Massilimicrobiota sp. An80]
MANVVHFNMIVDINQLLKEKGIEYSIHAIGACTCNGLELRQDGKEYPIDEIIEYMNEYLDKKWMRVRKSKENEHILNVESKFDYEK